MAQGVYIASIQSRSGKSLAALGLMELASRRVAHPGFFRPVVPGEPEDDREISLMRARYGLEAPQEALCGLRYDEARVLAGTGRSDELLERIFDRYTQLESSCDFVVVEGTDYTGVAAAFEFEFNARIASHLGTPVFFVHNGQRRQPAELVEDVTAARRAFLRQDCSIVATLINRVEPESVDAVRRCFASEWHSEDPVYVVPETPTLAHPSLGELASALGGEVLFGDAARLEAPAGNYIIAAMELPHVLERLQPGSVVITGGDRVDVVLGCLATVRATSFPNLAGIVLTGGIQPPPAVKRLFDGLSRVELPILSVPADTFQVATAVHAMQGTTRAGDQRKIATALGLFEEHVDLTELEARIRVSRSTGVTPLRFEYELIERAKKSRRHIVLPEGTDERVLRATEILLRRGVVDITLLGDPAEVRRLAATLGADLQDAAIIDPLQSPLRREFAETYHALRRHKGVNLDRAYDAMGDVSYFGTMMVYQGLAHGMVSGAAHTTAHTIRPAFEFVRAREGVSVVSSVFFMCLRDRVLVYGDCAVNPNPNPEQLADIAISSALTARTFGIEPRVALLSYSTGESGEGEDVEKVREAAHIARGRRPDLPIEGPIQYDAAVDASVAKKKLPDSQVAGQATVFIFPDLNTGNNTYKAVQRSAGAVAIGPVLQGLNKPVNDLSRGCTVPDIVNTVAVTAIQAQAVECEG